MKGKQLQGSFRRGASVAVNAVRHANPDIRPFQCWVCASKLKPHVLISHQIILQKRKKKRKPNEKTYYELL